MVGLPYNHEAEPDFGVWRSPVAHRYGVPVVGGSNPLAPTRPRNEVNMPGGGLHISWILFVSKLVPLEHLRELPDSMSNTHRG